MSSDQRHRARQAGGAEEPAQVEQHPHPLEHEHPHGAAESESPGHDHPHDGPHRPHREHDRPHDNHEHDHGHDNHEHDHGHNNHERDLGHDHGHAGHHGHSHGLVDPSIVRSRAGVKAVSISLAVLVLASVFQLTIFLLSGSVALLADLIHNFGDASTALPLGIAFFLRSFRGEKIAGLFVVATIFISACVALYETIQRFIHPQDLTHLWALAFAGFVGFVGNEIAAYIRYRAGKRLSSPALIADGNHARVDGFVSLGVIGSAIGVGLGANIADPIIGLVITLVILKITWDSWRVVSTTEPGKMVDPEQQTGAAA